MTERVGIAEQIGLHLIPNHRQTFASVDIIGAEPSALVDARVSHDFVIGGCTDHGHAHVGAAKFGLGIGLNGWCNRANVSAHVFDGFNVAHRDGLLIALTHQAWGSTASASTTANGQEVCAQSLELLGDAARRTRTQAGQGDHGCHADDHTQGSQNTAGFIAQDCPPCNVEGLSKIESSLYCAAGLRCRFLNGSGVDGFHHAPPGELSAETAFGALEP